MAFLNENGLSYYDRSIKQHIDNIISTHNTSNTAHQDIRDLIDIIINTLQVENWSDVKTIVNSGLASRFFSVGDQFTCKKGNDEIVWDLIGIDEDVPTTSTATISGTGITAVDVDYITFLGEAGEAGEFVFVYDGSNWKLGDNAVTFSDYGVTTTGTPVEEDTITVNIPHNITLQMHDVDSTNLTFSAPQAAFYIDETTYPTGLAAGTYNFTWSYSSGSVESGTYQFTLAEAVPVGGQIVIEANGTSTALTSCTISTYATAGSTTAIESNISISSGDGGTNIGTISTTAASITDTHTIAQRVLNGSSDYSTSAVRQYLNSDGAANTWWQPQSNFDRPANADNAGFLNGIEEDFIDVLGTVIKKTQKATIDGGAVATSTEKVFLLSRAEVYGATEGSTPDGIPYSYYKDNSDLTEAGTGADSNRIKKQGSTAKKNWLRTASSTSAIAVKSIGTNGSIGSTTVSGNTNAAPAVVIY